ncbi:hypothetical protein BJ170DRAFT_592232 [Xylariales sp. AK1849]|nr:hypothetical protein BJ170DRAFT_592232 [Xylariales sp. AK1849]
MANPQDVGGKQRHRRRRHPRSPSSSDRNDWKGQQDPVVDSLPYRTRNRDIQMPDSRKPKHSSSSPHRRQASENMRTSECIPPPTLTRPATVTHRSGMDPLTYEDNVYYGRRPRMRARARSRSSSTSESSSSSSSRGVTVTTPRSARVNQSTPDSRRSSRSSSSRRTPSVDSESSVSTEADVKEISRRVRRDDRRVAPATGKTDHRRHHRRHKGKEPVIHEDEVVHESRHVAPVDEGKDVPQRRHRHHSDSRSSSRRRHHHHRDHREQVRPSHSSKRGQKKYYESGPAYSDRPKLSRSHTTSSSHVTSSQSVSTSSKRSSTFISNFFGAAVPPADKHSKLCCTEEPIPIKHVDRLFDINFKKTWNQKFQEFSTRNRIYCPARRCGEWIQPDRIQRFKDGRKLARCGNCKTEVCCACNGRWHRSKDCPKDEATKELLEQARERGWQRCYNCKMLVELKEGCNHMTCSEFCMICGAKWKSCECPWFNYDTVEQDRLEHMQVPVNVRMDHDRVPASPRGEFRTAPPSGHTVRPRPQNYEEEMSIRRMQEQRDEELARRLQYDDTDDDYAERYGEVVGVGNSAGHFMNDDYRRGPQGHVVPPVPSPPMPSAFERNNTGDYVSGVNRARGVPGRGNSMERRLADRFSEQRQGSSPTHRSFSHPIPPPPAPPGMGPGPGPPPPPPPPGAPFMRRHTMEEELYNSSPRTRLAERLGAGRVRPDYEAEAAVHTLSSRRKHREREPPKDSVLAGLTGQGSGMNRVFEWRDYVAPGEPDGIAVG